MKKAIIMVGLPASGKSTWVALSDEVWDDKYVTISSDEVIEDLAFRYNYTYDQIFSDVATFANRVFHDKLKYNIENGANVLIDRTNLSEEVRKPFIDKLQEAGYHITAHVFTCDPEVREKRLAARQGKRIPKEVIASMAKRFVLPTNEEGFDNIVLHGLKKEK